MGGTVDVAGLAFQEPGTVRGYSERALTAKILCERHNNALSPLDTAAADFFTGLRRIDAAMRDGSVQAAGEHTINAADVERWMLKALAGLTYGGLIEPTGLRADADGLGILFGGEWPPGWGMYHVANGAPTHAFGGVEVRVRTRGDAAWGADFNVAGFSFQLNLGRPGRDQQLSFRPAGMVFTRDDWEAQQRLLFGWPRRPKANFVQAARIGSYDGQRPQDTDFRRV